MILTVCVATIQGHSFYSVKFTLHIGSTKPSTISSAYDISEFPSWDNVLKDIV